MSKRQFIMVLGVWVMAFLFLGIPKEMDKIIALLSGLVIVVVAYRLGQQDSKKNSVPFVEHKVEQRVEQKIEKITEKENAINNLNEQSSS